ncbi:hypothetical protein CTAYLR_001607 [Chrysophaeum taylorii]|uniref:Inositol polyphosphate-related phosphatase domain-containing protein n=1 Tax=Chrysophaeum taylorii TaxID=2483200 RepID=A0AAD7XHW3_9STRA|nr:hypothetical protein CTAYLR_001607 [Chrysophaeum taylorii]
MLIDDAALSISCCTWNVGGIDAPGLDVIRRWIDKGSDLIFVGLCEMIELSAIRVVRESVVPMSHERAARLQAWRHVLRSHLSEYELMCEDGLCGLALFVFSLRDQELASRALTATHRLGFGGLPNKGAVAARLEFERGATLCVVHSHFAADQDQCHARNANYRHLTNETWVFGAETTEVRLKPKHEFCTCGDFLCGESMPTGPVEARLLDHSLLIWMGDLNYRLDDVERGGSNYNPLVGGVTPASPEYRGLDAELEAALESKDYQHVVDSCCQLKRAMKQGDAFEGFREAPIRFPPTYKLIKNTPRLTYTKSRRPAWCDRVLWRTRNDYLYRGNAQLVTPPPRYLASLLGTNYDDACDDDDDDDAAALISFADHAPAIDAPVYAAVPTTLSDHLPVKCLLRWHDFWDN